MSWSRMTTRAARRTRSRSRALAGPAVAAVVGAAAVGGAAFGGAAPALAAVTGPTTTAGLGQATVAGVGAGGRTDTVAPQSTPRPCPFEVPDGLSARCATVTVPLNRNRPSERRTAQLTVARVSRGGAAARATPVAFLNGGPGSPTLASGVASLISASPLLAGRDVVLWDQRGTGTSRPRLGCPEVDRADAQARRTAKPELADALARISASRACADRLVADGVDLSAFTTVQNAGDVEDIRRALGIRRWDLWGVSYGTTLAQETARRYPHGIRRLVLDSVVPPAGLTIREAATSHHELDRLLLACQRDRECRAMLPDPGAAVDRLIARLQAAPRTVVVPADPETAAPAERLVLTGNDAAQLLAQATGSVTGATADFGYRALRSLPRMLAWLDADDPRGWRELDALTRAIRGTGAPAPLDARQDTGMATAVLCHDRRRGLDRAEALAMIRDTPRLSGTVRGQFSGLDCPDWPSGTAPASFSTPLRSGVPTLVVAGEFDYQTPLDWSRQVADGLPDARFVVFGSSGHAVGSGTPCGQQVISSYLGSADAEPDTRCVPPIRSTPFLIS